MRAIEAVLDALLADGADRRSVVVALGGGVIGDIAGFARDLHARHPLRAGATTLLRRSTLRSAARRGSITDAART